MNEELAAAIKDQANWLDDVFAVRFRTAEGWLAYIDENFVSQKASSILNSTAPVWTEQEFQALYVACWIYQPVVKGSYMIKLSLQQAENAQAGFDNLTARWSSHLNQKIDGATAGEGFKFLRKYKELLVKLEALNGHTYLFLKSEGHATSDPRHVGSWVTKKLTGAGNDVNPEFVRIVEENEQLGISKRGAENYSPEYRKLLKFLSRNFKKTMKKHGEVVSVREVVPALIEECRKLIRERQATTKTAGQFESTLIRKAGGSKPNFSTIPNYKVAGAFDAVLLFAEMSLPNLNSRLIDGGWVYSTQFGEILEAAYDDLKTMADELRRDPDRSVRYFQEITVTPDMVDERLAEAVRLLT